MYLSYIKKYYWVQVHFNYSNVNWQLVRLVTNWGLSSSVSGQGGPVTVQLVITCSWV